VPQPPGLAQPKPKYAVTVTTGAGTVVTLAVIPQQLQAEE
jgi:hypothetical protein